MCDASLRCDRFKELLCAFKAKRHQLFKIYFMQSIRTSNVPVCSHISRLCVTFQVFLHFAIIDPCQLKQLNALQKEVTDLKDKIRKLKTSSDTAAAEQVSGVENLF